jgi:hypothetical protein
VYQYNGEGEGDCSAFATFDIADGGCTRSDKMSLSLSSSLARADRVIQVDSPRGEEIYEVVDGCEKKAVGSTIGSIIAKAGPIGNGYNCLRQESTFTSRAYLCVYAVYGVYWDVGA